MYSHKSEYLEGLEYNLVLPESLSKLQQTQIISTLDKYRELIPSEEDEQVDGLASVIENNKKKMIMITTHAAYLLSFEDYSIVERRVMLEDIFGLIISRKKDGFVIGVKVNYTENIIIKSEFVEDIVKALQQLNFEAFNVFFPWVTHENSSDFTKFLHSKEFIAKDLQSQENLAVLKAIVQKGNVGETKILVEKCSSSSENKEKDTNFVLTDEAVYSLDLFFNFVFCFSLKKIDKIVFNKKEEYAVIYEQDGVHIFRISLEVCEKIKEEARKVENKIKITDE